MRRGGAPSRWLLLASLAALAALPTPAGAATQIGQTFVPTFDCQDNVNFLVSATPGPSYSAPFDGVLTSWSFEAPATGTDLLKFKVGRAVAGNRFTVTGESPGGLMDPVAGSLNTYPIRIPVRAGDLIGFYWNQGNTALCSALRDGFHIRNHTGDVPPGTTTTFTEQTVYQLDISAALERDCDQDGLGDETQDTGTVPCPTCRGVPATIIGTNGSDTRVGTPGRDVMVGLGGKDKLSGLAGSDLICGAAGKDTISGGKGNDKLFGEAGKDILKGGPGKDKLVGGPGKDKQVQ